MNDTPDDPVLEATERLTDQLERYAEELFWVKKTLNTQTRHVKQLLAAIRVADKAGGTSSAPLSMLLADAYAHRDAAQAAAQKAWAERDLMKQTLEAWSKTALAGLMKPDPVVDYRALLAKYVYHVGACEGITFVSHINDGDPDFTAEELAELRRLDKLGTA